MRIIGLTGGIACGKSTISLTLKSLGATIIDGDQLSRALTQPGGLALPAIRAEFGSEVFHADGTLDRRALGSLIFASDERRHALDDLMQPLLREMIEREILRAKEGGAKICVLDMPLLYEAGLDGLCNTVWCASLPRWCCTACPRTRARRSRRTCSTRTPTKSLRKRKTACAAKWTRRKRRAGRTSSSRQTAQLKKPPR